MKHAILATILIAGLATTVTATQAAADDQSTPPAIQPGTPQAPPPGPWGMNPHGPGPMMPPMMPPGGWKHGKPGMWPHHDMFGLFAPTKNKNLTPADVKIIAEAILLEHGNHSWTVSNITTTGTTIKFSFTTPHGDTIATFTLDPTTGHISRVS